MTQLDLAGIGAGPFSMSVAAHLDGIPGVSAAFFDRRPEFSWHPGLMLPGVELQNSFLKDLVSAVNPTSPWSFLSYLVRHKRFYSFLNCEYTAVPRRETAAYFKWVADTLPSLRYGQTVDSVDFVGKAFVLRFADGSERRARNLLLGTGTTPSVPACAVPLLGETCFHSSEIVQRKAALRGQRVAIIGGGQSGAEVFLNLINGPLAADASVLWFSRRPNFEPLDASAFTNEYFSPGYCARFHGLDPARKPSKLAEQKLASDGASPSTLLAIYRRLYEMTYLEGSTADLRLMPSREMLSLEREDGVYRLTVRNGFDGAVAQFEADAVVLATGYTTAVPACLSGLRDRIALDDQGRYTLAADYSLAWDGPADNRIFAVNASRHSHGIVDPQMSIAAWRGAVIVNALLGRAHFDLTLPPPVIQWSTADSVSVGAALLAEAAE